MSLILQRPRLFRAAAPPQPTARPRIVLVLGLPGSGKTVACEQYLADLTVPSCIITLARQPSYPSSELLSALQHVGSTATSLPEAVQQVTAPVTVVLDGGEAGLEDDGRMHPDIETWIAALYRNPMVQLVVASRVTPYSPTLTAAATHGQVVVIDGADLACTLDEAQALWTISYGGEPTAQQLSHLLDTTAGHIARVGAACRLGQPLLAAHPSLQRAVFADLLAGFPPLLYQYVLDLAFIDDLDPHTMASLTTHPSVSDTLALLENHQVLVPGDPPHLHPFVRAAAQAVLERDPVRRKAIIDRTRVAALDHGLYSLAFRLAAQDRQWDEAQAIIQKYGPLLREQGQVALVLGYIRELPPSFQTREVQILAARCQADLGDLDGAVLIFSRLRATATDAAEQRDLTIWLALVVYSQGDLREADALIAPYRDDADLPPVLAVRMARIHAIALMQAGQGHAAWTYLSDALQQALLLPERRVLALAYQDLAAIAGQMGLFFQADDALRRAERCWKDIGSPSDAAYAMNGRAMVLLGQQLYSEARLVAQQARIEALAADKIRIAAGVSATTGDIALAQRQFADALAAYQVAVEEADRAGAHWIQSYSLAMHAWIALLTDNHDLARQVLPRLQARSGLSIDHAAWLLAGVGAATLASGFPLDTAFLRAHLAMLSDAMPEPTFVILAALAHGFGHPDSSPEAQEVATRLMVLLQTQPAALLLHRLLPLCPTAFLTPPAQRLPAPSSPALPAPQGAPSADLQIEVLGERPVVRWQGTVVQFPARGVELLVFFLTTSLTASEEAILRALTTTESFGQAGLHRLIARIHHSIPKLVQRKDGIYTLDLARHRIQFDADVFHHLDFQALPTDDLRAWIQRVMQGNYRGLVGAWTEDLRTNITQRLAACWLELGHRAEQASQMAEALRAYDQAFLLATHSDAIVRTVLHAFQRSGDRSLLIRRYLQYQAVLDQELGLEPAQDLTALYLQALEP